MKRRVAITKSACFGILRAMHTNESLILLGIKHSGKTTQGKLLARHFALPFIDIDFVIEKMTGKAPRRLYAEEGAAAFMLAEENA